MEPQEWTITVWNKRAGRRYGFLVEAEAPDDAVSAAIHRAGECYGSSPEDIEVEKIEQGVVKNSPQEPQRWTVLVEHIWNGDTYEHETVSGYKHFAIEDAIDAACVVLSAAPEALRVVEVTSRDIGAPDDDAEP